MPAAEAATPDRRRTSLPAAPDGRGARPVPGERGARTAPDTQVLPFAGLVALLHGAPWRRLAVLGDSIAEGVGEPYPGYRSLSWIDRIAEPLRAQAGGLAVMNLGRRDLFAREVRELQLDAALAFRPDLAIVAAGGNDALHRSFDHRAVCDLLDGIVASLRRSGADVLMIELMDIVASGLVPPQRVPSLDARFGALAAATRAVARSHGAILVSMREHPASADPAVYASDRLHLNARGHAIVGTEAVRALGTAIVGTEAARALSTAIVGTEAARAPGTAIVGTEAARALGTAIVGTKAARAPGTAAFSVEITLQEILEDLFWPDPPPGRWPGVPAPLGRAPGGRARPATRAPGRPRRSRGSLRSPAPR